MAVFLNGPIGPFVALCVELDSNYVIETAPVLLRLMEENVAKARISQKGEHAQWDLVSYQLMEVFQNGPTGQTVVCRVALDSNYVIETVPVLLRRMEDKVVKARILQKGEYV